MKRKLKEKGMALVFTFSVLVLLGGLVASLIELSTTSSELHMAIESSQTADVYAEVGIRYYMHGVNTMTVQGLITEDMLAWLQAQLNVPKTFGTEGGYFMLTHVEGLDQLYAEYQFYIRVRGYFPTYAAAKGSFSNLVDTAYAQQLEYKSDGQAIMVTEYEAVVSAQSDGGGAFGITTKVNPNVQSNSNNVYAYPDGAIYNAPGLGSPNTLNLDSSVTNNSNTSLINQRMDLIVAEANRRIDAAKDLISNASLTGRSASNLPSISSNAFHFPAGNYDWSSINTGNQGGNDSDSPNQGLVISSGNLKANYSGPYESVSSSNRNVIFGSSSTFSKMKFNRLAIRGDEWKVRFYPGVYEFRRLEFFGKKNTIFLDTTTGPVYISVPHNSGNRFTMDGDKNAILAFKDNTYVGKDVTGTVDINPSNDPAYFENYDNKVDIANAKNDDIANTGRRIAQFFIETRGNSDEEFLVEGNHNLIGGTVIGNGGNGTVGIPSISSSASNGSEVQEKSGGGWEIADTDINNLPVSAESLLMYGGASMEFKVDGNNNTMIGGYFCNQCGNHSNEFMMLGGNNTLYGAISNAGRIQVSNGSNALYLDTRLYPFPPKPVKGSVSVYYIRKVSQF